MKFVMPRELRAVVEADALPPLRRQRLQNRRYGASDGCRRFARRAHRYKQPRVALVQRQYRLPVPPEQHQVRLPMPRRAPVSRLFRSLRHRPPMADEGRRTAAFAPPPASLRLPSRQVTPPTVVLRACQLPIYEPIYRLVRDHPTPRLKRQTPSYLLRRPAPPKPSQHPLAQPIVTLQLAPPPATRPRLLVRIPR